MIRHGTIYVCASPKARKGRWRSVSGHVINGPRYRDVVTVTETFLERGKLALQLKEWPGASYFAEHFRPVQKRSEAQDVTAFLPLLRTTEAAQ